jgi:hypothetical protein
MDFGDIKFILHYFSVGTFLLLDLLCWEIQGEYSGSHFLPPQLFIFISFTEEILKNFNLSTFL